jgi:hypothetical protein
MIVSAVKRPRNVDGPRAAVAGYASFWLIAAMCVLTALVGLNYHALLNLVRGSVIRDVSNALPGQIDLVAYA